MPTQDPRSGRAGGGQSGYGAGRTGDRALGPGYRNPPSPPESHRQDPDITRQGAPDRTGHDRRARRYTRSDDRIKEHAREALTDDPQVDAMHIEVIVQAGEVILTGTVEDRRQKRLAEDCLEGIVGIKDIHNQLRLADLGLADNPIHGGEVAMDEARAPSEKKYRA